MDRLIAVVLLGFFFLVFGMLDKHSITCHPIELPMC